MSSLDYAKDVARLASAVRPFVGELPAFGPPHSAGVYVLDLHIRASSLREMVAAQQALQLAFDAATAAVLYPDELEVRLTHARLERPDVVLHLVWAANGSLRQAFVLAPTTADGRERLRSIFGIGFLALAGIPGGLPFAIAYYTAFEGILFLGRLAELQTAAPSPVLIATIDEDALARTHVDVKVTPPDVPWQPPR